MLNFYHLQITHIFGSHSFSTVFTGIITEYNYYCTIILHIPSQKFNIYTLYSSNHIN